MTTFDLVGAVVLLASLLLGAWRGLVYEVLSLLSWVVAFWVAQGLAGVVAPHLPLGQAAVPVRYAAGFLLVFVVVVFALGLVSWLGRKLIEATGLRPADRALGALFGAARAVVLMLVVALVVASTTLQQSAWWQDSFAAPWLVAGVQQLRPLLPQEFEKYLSLPTSR